MPSPTPLSVSAALATTSTRSFTSTVSGAAGSLQIDWFASIKPEFT